jgi:alpha-L-fucosidase
MTISILRCGMLLGLLACCLAPAADEYAAPQQPGQFNATPASLKQYRVLDWFRKAKFGIWSHCGPQAVPRAGDWYARHMYLEGTPQYQHHL